MDIKDYFNSDEITDVRFFDFENIIFDDRTRDWCKENLCSKYSTCWTCPPGAGSLDGIKGNLKQYDSAVLFSVAGHVNSREDIDSALKIGRKSRDMLINIRDKMLSDGLNVTALGGGACDICVKCTYPDSPCRFPEKAVMPIESCGINVMDMAVKLGMKTDNGKNTITYFALILWSRF